MLGNLGLSWVIITNSAVTGSWILTVSVGRRDASSLTLLQPKI